MSLDQWIVLHANLAGGSSLFVGNIVIFLAEYLPYFVVIAFLYFAFRSRQAFFERMHLFAEGVGAAIIARGFVEVFRFFIHRPRPFVDDHAIVALLNETSYSFPSGHATFFFALSTVVYFYDKRWGVWFFFASTVISLARIMGGVHYLTDIIGGVILGIFVSILTHSFLRRF